MDEAGKNAWCPEHGVYPAALDRWCARAISTPAKIEEARASPQTIRKDKKCIKEFERVLLRTEPALTETAGLLFLSKKAAAIFNNAEVKQTMGKIGNDRCS